MAYDALAAERVRSWIGRKRGFEEKSMFGGIGFLLNGNMCMGIWKESLVLRIGTNAWESYLEQDDVGEFDITGRSTPDSLLSQSLPPTSLNRSRQVSTAPATGRAVSSVGSSGISIRGIQFTRSRIPRPV